MKLKVFPVVLLAAALASAASAQTKISGTMQCGKPDPQSRIEVGDRPGHFYVIGKTACTWSKSFDMGGVATKDGSSTAFSEVSSDKSADHGHHVGTGANGDKYFVQFQGSSTSDKGILQSQEGTWSYTGGTGKLAGLQGKGTYKSTANAEGTTVQIDGEYKLP